jgi:transposase-like protein
MGRYFNENLLHAKHWPRRGREDLRQEMAERRKRKKAEMPVQSVGANLQKHAGGRPALNVDRVRVYDSLAEGKSISDVAREHGISRGSVYNLIKNRRDLNEEPEHINDLTIAGGW